MQGAIAALDHSDEVLLGSYVLAGSTAKYILSQKPQRVSIVAMGWELKEIAPEDEWCASYISHLLGSGDYDHTRALREIIYNRQTQKFLQREKTYFPPEDPILCLQRDMYEFVLCVRRSGDLIVVRKKGNQASSSV